MNPSLLTDEDGTLTYLLKPNLKYHPNKLDSSGYPGKVIYRRSVV
jgi:hypothetical protein